MFHVNGNRACRVEHSKAAGIIPAGANTCSDQSLVKLRTFETWSGSLYPA